MGFQCRIVAPPGRTVGLELSPLRRQFRPQLRPDTCLPAAAIPGLTFRAMPSSDVCCGSAGIYNVVENPMAMRILAHKMEAVNATGAGIVATANPGCLLQLQAGVRLHGTGQRVMHVVEILDEAYGGREGRE